jgi:hypothetical protein
MDDLWDAYIERLKVHLQHPENLIELVAALDQIKSESGHGEIQLVVVDRRLELINCKVKKRAKNGESLL